MIRRPLLWHLFPSHLAVAALALLGMGAFAAARVRDLHLRDLASDLEARAALFRGQIAEGGRLAEPARIDALCKQQGRATGTRITVIDRTGRVLGDSERVPAGMENHLTPDRVELAAAVGGRTGVHTGYSGTLGYRMMYVAVPVRQDGQVAAAVRAALPATGIERELRRVYADIAVGLACAAAAVALVSLLVSRRLSRPLEELSAGAERFARGQLGDRLGVSDIREIGSLAGSMNEMAALLDERIRALTRQRSEQEAILSSMVEGVLAVDDAGRVVGLNRAGAQLLGLVPPAVRGKPVQEVLHNYDLQEFVFRVLERSAPVEGDIALLGGDGRQLEAHGAVLRDAGGREIGAVVVLNDVTRLKRLETVRRDFVANVSHELKTPVTSIRAAVETLQGGALRDAAEAARFTEMIARQADRLGAIIDDLLELSRVEQEEGQGLVLAPEALEPVLAAAAQACAQRAEARGVTVAVRCPGDLRAAVNPQLIENAVVNLIDNAVKHSEPGREVVVEGAAEPGGAVIRVIDRGCGIEKKHLPRLFERFYRVDKARSRRLGGTGLGLAIVKHIVQAHRGEVAVESTFGAGSTFTIRLPAS